MTLDEILALRGITTLRRQLAGAHPTAAVQARIAARRASRADSPATPARTPAGGTAPS